ncbi:MAG: hypothetical protein IT374_25360 [Polyangiaceae bacterium]|nr:hypothetical protein [Polyangiaceae bacterium]
MITLQSLVWRGGALLSVVAACGGDDDPASPGASSGGSAGTNSAGTSGGGSAGASGGSAGTSGGGSAGTNSAGTSSGGSAGASGGGAGGVPGSAGAIDHCAYSACEVCKATNCNAVDNPCNGDPACESAQQVWRTCVCYHAGSDTALAKCDADFLAVNSGAAKPVIDCVHTSCPGCTLPGDDTPAAPCALKSTDCQLCSLYRCRQEAYDCAKSDPACAAAVGAMQSCVCDAQQGNGSTPACLATFEGAGAAAKGLAACLGQKCLGECGVP